MLPAAFGRLCVETTFIHEFGHFELPAAFGRLCVETTLKLSAAQAVTQPPSGGCVLKL